MFDVLCYIHSNFLDDTMYVCMCISMLNGICNEYINIRISVVFLSSINENWIEENVLNMSTGIEGNIKNVNWFLYINFLSEDIYASIVFWLFPSSCSSSFPLSFYILFSWCHHQLQPLPCFSLFLSIVPSSINIPFLLVIFPVQFPFLFWIMFKTVIENVVKIKTLWFV